MDRVTRGKVGRPPMQMDTSWVLEQYDALTLEQEEDGPDDFDRLGRIAETHKGVEIPVVMG